MRLYGRLPDGSPVELLTLGSEDALQAEVLTLGGTLVSLTMPVDGRRIPLILTLPDLAAYRQDRNYMGQLVGRFANRIANAAITLDGSNIQLTANDAHHALHGGIAPFGGVQWRVVAVREGEAGFVKLTHLSPDGAGGFPGNLHVTASIGVKKNSLRLDFEAMTDAPTPVSFTWHPYFNLSGRPDTPISNHQLRLTASAFLPVNTSWIPTGEIAPVAGTSLDYRSLKQVGPGAPRTYGEASPSLNQCFVVDKNPLVVAELYCPDSQVRMELQSDLPGIQVYDGYYLREQYPGWHGIALEPGCFPNSPNQPNFPDCILRPAVTYRTFMSYSFFRGAP